MVESKTVGMMQQIAGSDLKFHSPQLSGSFHVYSRELVDKQRCTRRGNGQHRPWREDLALQLELSKTILHVEKILRTSGRQSFINKILRMLW